MSTIRVDPWLGSGLENISVNYVDSGRVSILLVIGGTMTGRKFGGSSRVES